jgi:hypothetical protein
MFRCVGTFQFLTLCCTPHEQVGRQRDHVEEAQADQRLAQPLKARFARCGETIENAYEQLDVDESERAVGRIVLATLDSAPLPSVCAFHAPSLADQLVQTSER